LTGFLQAGTAQQAAHILAAAGRHLGNAVNFQRCQPGDLGKNFGRYL